MSASLFSLSTVRVPWANNFPFSSLLGGFCADLFAFVCETGVGSHGSCDFGGECFNDTGENHDQTVHEEIY